MKHFSKKAVVFLWALGLSGILIPGRAQAGDTNTSPFKGEEKQVQSLSDEQKARVASILSQYNASSLTAADAKAINNAFREAGIRRGPGQRAAIEAAGFDPEKIRTLDPPPDRKRK